MAKPAPRMKRRASGKPTLARGRGAKGTAKPKPRPRARPGARSRRVTNDAPRADLVSHRRDGLPDVLFILPGKDGKHRYDPTLTKGDSWFDVGEAARYLDAWDELITHAEGILAGKPFRLEPWQTAIVANLAGWKRKNELGRVVRRYRVCFTYVPRKNGKTPFGAGLALIFWTLDDEPAAKIYSAAADREQAGLVYTHASGMVANEEEFSSRITPYGDKGGGHGARSLVWSARRSSYQVLSADSATKHGLNPSMVLVDELHAQPGPDLVETLESSMVSLNRPQPLMIYFTTADYDKPSICNDKLKLARSVRDNPGDPAKPGFDPSFLPVIYEATKDDDWESEKVWARVNPNLGVSVSLEALRAEHKKAKEQPSHENVFKRLHLNLQTEQAERWLVMAEWDACDAKVDPEALKGRECVASMDLSSTGDLTNVCLCFPPADKDDSYRFLWFTWVPADTIERRARRDKIPYDVWQRMGFIEETAGNVVDYDYIRARINALGKEYKITRIGYDPWNATQLALQLQGDGFEMLEMRQGYKTLNEPSKEVERLIKSRRFAHGGNPVLRWMAGNVSRSMDAKGNIAPDKKSSADKIDGIVTAVMGVGLWLASPPKGKSVYEERGLVVL